MKKAGKNIVILNLFQDCVVHIQAGFTLIELLIVVLIIGILTAVALPQYKLTTAKSRISAWIPHMKALQHAQEIYYMDHGSYTNKLEELDIDIPCRRTSSNGHADSYVCDDYHFIWVSDYADSMNWHYCPDHRNDWGRCPSIKNFSILVYHQHINSANKGKLICAPYNNNAFGKKVCAALKL